MFIAFGERETEREREKHQLVASCMHPDRGLNLQPRCVPWPGFTSSSAQYFTPNILIKHTFSLKPSYSLTSGSLSVSPWRHQPALTEPPPPGPEQSRNSGISVSPFLKHCLLCPPSNLTFLYLSLNSILLSRRGNCYREAAFALSKLKILWLLDTDSLEGREGIVNSKSFSSINKYLKHHTCNLRKLELSPSLCGSVDWVPACDPKDHRFDCQSGHMPGLPARSPVEGAREATTHWCVSHSFSLPSLLAKNK